MLVNSRARWSRTRNFWTPVSVTAQRSWSWSLHELFQKSLHGHGRCTRISENRCVDIVVAREFLKIVAWTWSLHDFFRKSLRGHGRCTRIFWKSLHGYGRCMTFFENRGRGESGRSWVKVDAPKGPRWKWTVQKTDSGRSRVKVDGQKRLKVDGLRKWTVKKQLKVNGRKEPKVDGPKTTWSGKSELWVGGEIRIRVTLE